MDIGLEEYPNSRMMADIAAWALKKNALGFAGYGSFAFAEVIRL